MLGQNNSSDTKQYIEEDEGYRNELIKRYLDKY